MHVVAQHPRDLRLLVQTAGDLPGGLNVLSQRQIDLGPLQRLTLRVIGESHWVTLESAGQRIDEVLACYQPRAEGALYAGAIPPSGVLGVSAGDYRCGVWTVPLDARVIACGRGADALEVAFPHPYGGVELPFTRLWWERDLAGDALIWHSIHAYALPAGPLAVLSRTRLALRSGAGGGPLVCAHPAVVTPAGP